jgi:hypothetical protein
MSHLRLVPPLEDQELPLEEQAPRQAVTLVPVRVRALAQELALALQLALDLEQELQQGLEEGLQLPRELVQDLELARAEALDLGSALARVGVLGLILEQE